MDATPRTKFDDFERRDYVYSTIEQHQLQASILVPKTFTEQAPHHVPVIVFWHGGGWITGDRLYEPWWPVWLIEFARSRNAIIITADYRLLPEATGSDIADDIEAFWTWLRGSLQPISEVESWRLLPDLSHILCVGQSAGGSMAVQSALVRPDMKIKAVVSLYAPLYDRIADLTVPQPRAIMGLTPPSPRQAEAKIRSYIKRTRGSVRSSGDPASMWELLVSILQQAWLPRLVYANPEDTRLHLLQLLEKREVMPPIWIVHGEQDSVTPAVCSTEFASRVRSCNADISLLLSMQQGEHMFDAELTMRERWIQEGCKFLSTYW